MILSPEGDVLAAMTAEELQLWDLREGRLRSATRTGGSALRDWCFSGDGSRLAIGLADGTVRLVHVHPERTAPLLETRPLSSREMIRFDVGAIPQRDQRRAQESALQRRIDTETLTGRIRTSRSPRNLMAYARRILSDQDPIADLFPEALEATIEALSPLTRRDPETLALLAKAQFLNGLQAEAVATAGDALALLPSNHPFRPRIITALVAYQSAMVGEPPRHGASR